MTSIYFTDNHQLDNLIYHLKNMDAIYSTRFVEEGFVVVDELSYEEIVYLADELEAEFKADFFHYDEDYEEDEETAPVYCLNLFLY